LEIKNGFGKLDLALLPLTPNLRRVILESSMHGGNREAIAINSAALINFVLALPNLEELDLNCELDEATITNQSSTVKAPSKIKTLFTHSGPVMPLLLLTSFQLDNLTTIVLKQTHSHPYIEDSVPDVILPADSLPSLRRIAVSNPSSWKPLEAMFAGRSFEYIEIGGISSTSGPLPFLVAPQITLKITLDMENMAQELIFIRRFRVPTLKTTEILNLAILRKDEETMASEDPEELPQDFGAFPCQSKTFAPLLSIIEITFERFYSVDLAVFQVLVDGINAQALSMISLSRGTEESAIHFKLTITGSHQVSHTGVTTVHTQPPPPPQSLRSASSVDVLLELNFEASMMAYRWPSALSDASLLLQNVGRFAPLRSINLLTVFFRGVIWSNLPKENDDGWPSRSMLSMIMARMKSGPPIRPIVVLDATGVVDWEASIADEEPTDEEFLE
jgi:hypothetical protein